MTELALPMAACGVAALATGQACLRVRGDLDAMMQTLTDGVRSYSGKLDSAAQRYRRGDDSAAAGIDGVGLPE